MQIPPVTIKDVYTRKVGGETYDYEAQYTPGPYVAWNAKVFQDGDLKGTPQGVLSDNLLTGEELKQQIITFIECTIEVAQGIEE